MLLVHEVHRVAGAKEDAFDAAYRDELIPALAERTAQAVVVSPPVPRQWPRLHDRHDHRVSDAAAW